jgi:hypothetical protein
METGTEYLIVAHIHKFIAINYTFNVFVGSAWIDSLM